MAALQLAATNQGVRGEGDKNGMHVQSSAIWLGIVPLLQDAHTVIRLATQLRHVFNWWVILTCEGMHGMHRNQFRDSSNAIIAVDLATK